MNKNPCKIKKHTKKSQQKPEEDNLEYPEPYRKSVFDVLKENLAFTGRNFFLMRIYIIGEHTLENDPNIQTYFTTMVKNVNTTTADEKITGALFFYNTIFCCVVEGSEDSIFEFFKRCFYNDNKKFFGKIKLINEEFHVLERLAEDWFSYTNPETQTVSEHSDSSFDIILKLIKTGVTKINELATLLNKIFMDTTSVSSEGDADESIPMKNGFLDYYDFKLLFESEYLKDIDHFMKPFLNPYSMLSEEDDENIWPIPEDLIIYNIFDDYVEPISNILS